MACSTCTRTDLAVVNAALAAADRGDPGVEGINGIARRFGIVKTSLIRHRDNCVRTGKSPVPTRIDLASIPHVAPASEPPRPPPRGPAVVVPINRHPTFSGRAGAGRQCLVCASPNRHRIEEALMRGVPWYRASKTIEGAPSKDSIRRHARRCIPDVLTRAHAAADASFALRVSEDIDDTRDIAMALLGEAHSLAEDAHELHEKCASAKPCSECGMTSEVIAELQESTLKKVAQASQVAERAARILEVAGKITGEIRPEGSLVKHPDWPALARAIAEAVAGCDGCSRSLESILDPRPGIAA